MEICFPNGNCCFRYKPYMSYTFDQWIDLINYNWVALTLVLQWCIFINFKRGIISIWGIRVMLSKCGDEKLQSHKINKQTKKKKWVILFSWSKKSYVHKGLTRFMDIVFSSQCTVGDYDYILWGTRFG